MAVLLGAAATATAFVGTRLTLGSPLLSTGGDQAFVHHRARLEVLSAWHRFAREEISLSSFLQHADSEFPPALHGLSLLLGSLVGHSADVVLWTGLLWLFVLAGSTGLVTSQLLTSRAASQTAPAARVCSPAAAGAAATTAVLLLGSYQGMAARYYYDLPMPALLWAGAAMLLSTWDRRPLAGGLLTGVLVTAACLTKWTAIPFALATGLGLLLTVFGCAPAHRRRRATTLATALAVTAGLVCIFMATVREGGNQSSLEVMGGTFDAQSGEPLTGDDIRSVLHDLAGPQETEAPTPLPRLVLRDQMDAPDRMAALLWAQLDPSVAPSLIVGSDGDEDLIVPGLWTPGPLPTSALAVADVDGDGDLDLAISAGGRGFRQPNRLHLTTKGQLEHRPSWSSNETDYSTSLDWGDLDGDGDPDLAVGNGSGPLPNRVYRNNRGRLEATAHWRSEEADDTRAIAWGDWDGDGDPDLAVGNRLTANHIYVNQEGRLSLAWSSSEEDETTCLAWGDWEGDGDLDLAVGNNEGGVTRVYLNSGNSFELGWTSIEADSTLDIAWADWDGDGDLDLAVANEDGPDRVYETDGNELLLAWSSPEVRRSVALAWLTGEDGTTQLAIGDADSRQVLFYAAPDPTTGQEDLGDAERRQERALAGDNTRPPPPPATSPATRTVESDHEVHQRSVRRRLAFYPRWLVKSVLSPALTMPLVLLMLCWLVMSRVGLALVLTTVFGQAAFLLLFVPPLDERFIMTLVPALFVAGATGWSVLPSSVRRWSGIMLMTLMLVVCWDFHIRESKAFTTSEPFVRLSTLEDLGLDNASYADGAWRRGDAERREIAGQGDLTGPQYRRFRSTLWDIVDRCEARTVVIGGTGSMVDSKDWWRYRVALHDGEAGSDPTDHRSVRVIQDVDLASSLRDPDGAVDLVLSQVEAGASPKAPERLEGLSLELTEQVRIEGVSTTIAVYRPSEIGACPPPDPR